MGTSSVEARSGRSLATSLLSAASEWLLICMLFLDSIFSFFIRKCASLWKLCTPCLLCSRLDHIFGAEKTGYLWKLICRKHKLEISSLILCHAHNKLVNVHEICESCLFSFATINKSNLETYRLLVGKLGEDPYPGIDGDPLLGEKNHDILSQRHCSCCKEPYVPRAFVQTLIQTRLSGLETEDLDVPLSSSVVHCKEDVQESPNNPLAHVRYRELKIASDTESDGTESILGIETADSKDDLIVQGVDMEPNFIEAADSKDDLNVQGFVHTLIRTRSSGLEKEDLNIPSSTFVVHCKEDLQESPNNPYGNESILGIETADSKDDLIVQGVDMEPNFTEAADSKDNLMVQGLVHTLIQTRSSGLEIEDLDVPLLSSIVHCKEDLQESPSNHLPHVQYRELKIVSDTESDGNGSILGDETADSKDDLIVQGVDMERNCIDLDSNLTSTKLVEPASAPEPLVLEPLVILGDLLPPVECDVEIGHGLDELTPKHVDADGVFSAPTDLLSLDKMLPSSNAMATSVEALEENCVNSNEEYETKCRETEKAEISSTKATFEAGSEAQPVSSDAVQMAPNVLELGDAYKLAIGTRGGRQMSGKLSEQWIVKDSSKVSEDLKLFMTQLSFNRLSDQSRDMSPRLSINGDEPRNFDVSSAAGMQMLQKKFSLERNESGLESLDGSIVSEIEGENAVDQLRRQVEYDKKLMSSLYKELEEERNASAIAANQAMAMITRLQEEKASLHMEALQCIRMMEEQGEYDDEALQKANDLITEKEKEIQDLEAELEFYRIKFPNAYTTDNLVEASNVKERDIRVVHSESNQIGTIGYETPISVKADIDEKVGSEGRNLLLEFEDEKLDIMQCLKKLENMLHLFSNNGVKIDLSNGEYLENRGSFSSGANDLDTGNRKLEDGEDDDRLPSLASPTFDKESIEHDCSDRNSVSAAEVTDFTSLRNEMLNLNKRMEVLEADKNFLEQTITSLRKGEEGLQLVQEIASHLRELRKVGIRS